MSTTVARRSSQACLARETIPTWVGALAVDSNRHNCLPGSETIRQCLRAYSSALYHCVGERSSCDFLQNMLPLLSNAKLAPPCPYVITSYNHVTTSRVAGDLLTYLLTY